MHKKEAAIAPAFAEFLGMQVVVAAIDTDQYGTFAGEIKRMHSPKATAIAKAQAGMNAENLPIGLASEGTIGPHPVSGFTTVDTEIMVFVDNELDLVIDEKVQSFNIVAQATVAAPHDDISEFLRKADFPRHGLIVRPEKGPVNAVAKGITDLPTLKSAIEKYSANSGRVLIENDFRAHFSPSRMDVILQCSELLAERVASTCPDCLTPGWGRIDPIRGLDCSDCGNRIDWAIQADRSGCYKCENTEIHPRPIHTADPRWCNTCNP